MKTIMKLEDLTTIEPLQAFLASTQAVAFPVISGQNQSNLWMQGAGVRSPYLNIPPGVRGNPLLSLAVRLMNGPGT